MTTNSNIIFILFRKIPSVLPKFEDMLDDAITLAEHDINDVDCEIKLDYKESFNHEYLRLCVVDHFIQWSMSIL